MFAALHAPGNLPVLLDCARQFSPLIEITSEDTVTFDVRGLNSLCGSLSRIANEVDRVIGVPANIAIASNPDTAVHVSRGMKGIAVIPAGQEGPTLAPLSLHLLGCPPQMGEMFQLWGIRTFGQFASLPPLGVAARLGEEGMHWQQVAQGVMRRQLRIIGESVSFARQMDLDDPILLLEPLLFLLGRFLNELCAELISRSLASNEVRLRLRLEKGAEHPVILRLPVPTTDQKMLLKLLHLELSEHPPVAAITQIRLEMEPAKPRSMQEGLFAASYPFPEKIELTVARIRHLVGPENIGSPRVLDTHKPDSFVMEPFAPSAQHPAASVPSSVRLAFRRFRPPQSATVIVERHPVHILSASARGPIQTAKGPWFTTGNWWRTDCWNREEWDVAVGRGALYRIFRDLSTEAWFVEGNYD